MISSAITTDYHSHQSHRQLVKKRINKSALTRFTTEGKQGLHQFDVLNRDSIAIAHRNEDTRISFQLSGLNNQQFTLLKGMLEFSKPSGIRVYSNRDEHAFLLNFPGKQPEEAVAYLSAVLRSFEKEIRFRSLLREIIRVEQQMNITRSLLYRNLQETAV